MSLLAIYVGQLFILAIISLLDIKTRKISNYWPLLNFLFWGVAMAGGGALFTGPWYSYLLYPISIGTTGYLLYLLSIAGAGDVKYISTFFLTIPLNFHYDFFLLLLYVTILVSIINLLINFFSNFSEMIVLLKMRKFSALFKVGVRKFPFAPVILLAWMLWGWMNQGKIN